MIPLNAFNVSSFQASLHSILVLKIEGFYRSSTANIWLQFHDTNTTPALGAVPKKSQPLNAASPFYYEFKHGDLTFNLGCFVGLSSTEGTYTADGTDKMDVSVESRFPDPIPSVSFAGDLTSAVTSLQVWTEAQGLSARKSLLALEVDATNLTGAANQYLMIFAADTVNAGMAPVNGGIIPITPGIVYTGELKKTFGEFGRDVFSIDGEPNNAGAGGDPSPGKQRLGCTVVISSTPGTYTAANGTVCIKAEYRTAEE